VRNEQIVHAITQEITHYLGQWFYKTAVRVNRMAVKGIIPL